MPPRRKTGRRILRAFLPIILLLALVLVAITGWIVYGVTRPPRQEYLVTPEKFTQLSGPGLKASEETWTNRDGTPARGWLLRGGEGAPAVILLHRYGADRSWLLNLGVKLNETTNFTILWPDLRGHGLNPPVNWTSFSTREADDVQAALDYLRSLKTSQDRPLVGADVGLYGVELGAYTGLQAAARSKDLKALVLDSVPATPNDILNNAVRDRTGMDNGFAQWLARTGMKAYFMGGYSDAPSCPAASQLSDRQVLLLASKDTPQLQSATVALARCFPQGASVEVQSELPVSGYNLRLATGEQAEVYDRRVIDFLDKALRISR
ncbi:MAG: alpha/beta hydrolase [Pyrinomonadaceae bacterium]|nr:alpha/beta hydrolase [Pyrinomonadaceae bacterium]